MSNLGRIQQPLEGCNHNNTNTKTTTTADGTATTHTPRHPQNHSTMADDSLRPRPGPPPRLIAGPSATSGQRSLYQQQVLDEYEYTETLGRIIGRDFFPDLPHLRATNAYLSSLASNDAQGLSASIRQLARIAQDKDEGRSAWAPEHERERDAREREARDMRQQFDSTPRINLGQRGWDTPLDRGGGGGGGGARSARRARSVSPSAAADGGAGAGPSRPRKAARQVRDDLSLDAFQRNYTSEDNAAFASILDSENRERKARNQLVWDFERVQESRRLQGEERRKAILAAAQSGGWVVDANGRRMVGGLAQGSREKDDGEPGAWAKRRLLAAPPEAEAEAHAGAGDAEDGGAGALVKRTAAGALVKSTVAGAASDLREQPLPERHPLGRALELAGLPPTAVTDAAGAIVPARDLASGSGDGRGRGHAARRALAAAEAAALASEADANAGAGAGAGVSGGTVPQWRYRAMNGLMFPPDAYASPYPAPPASAPGPGTGKGKGPAPSVSYANTRLDGDGHDGGHDGGHGAGPAGRAPSTSYAGSWVDRAVRGTGAGAGKRRGGGGRRRPSAATDATSTIDGDDGDDYGDGDSDDDGDSDSGGKEYDLVDEEPDLEPDDLPLMTYGSLLATPKRISTDTDTDAGAGAGADDGPQFRFPEEKRRDGIGRRLGNKASRSISDRARMYAPSTPRTPAALRAAAGRTARGSAARKSGGSMPPPSARGNLTPAAQSLLQRTTGRTPMRMRGAPDEGIFKSRVGGMGWSPSPSPRR